MRANLKALAEKLAKMDGPAGRNLDVIDCQGVLAALGEHLRSVPAEEALDLVAAIAGRGGKQAAKGRGK